MTLAASHPSTPLLPFLGGEGRGRRDASCHEKRCQGRREISRRHSGKMPVKYKHSVVGKTLYPLPLLPLQPASLTFPVSPTSSQYGLFHPVGGSTSFFVDPHLSFRFSAAISSMTHISHFDGSFCSCMLNMHTQLCHLGAKSYS